MKNLDIAAVYRGIDRTYGENAVDLRRKRMGTVAYLSSASGMPLSIGGLAVEGGVRYCIEAYPWDSRNAYHKQMLFQWPGISGGRLVEENGDSCYGWGIDDIPERIQNLQLTTVEFAETVRDMMRGAYILNIIDGRKLAEFAWSGGNVAVPEYETKRSGSDEIAAIRDETKRVLSSDAVLAQIDIDMLRKFYAEDESA